MVVSGQVVVKQDNFHGKSSLGVDHFDHKYKLGSCKTQVQLYSFLKEMLVQYKGVSLVEVESTYSWADSVCVR